MIKSFFRVFFSKINENKWLNFLGKYGYLLKSIKDSKYYFEHNEGCQYFYSIEFLDYSAQSDQAVEYYESRDGLGIKPILANGNWVYFVSSQGEIRLSENVYKKNSKFYLVRFIYLFFFSLVGSIVSGYQIYAIDFLEKVGVKSAREVISLLALKSNNTVGARIVNAAKSVINVLIKVINGYFGLWFNIFGESKAVAVLSIVAPITIAVLIIGVFNLDEFIAHRILYKKNKVSSSSLKEIHDAE